MNLAVLYRGPLTSCNYACGYCPFAKRRETNEQLAGDRRSLERFVAWIERQERHRFRILFTPWGEALVRSWYRRAAATLSHASSVESVAFQTNLSSPLDWIGDCRNGRLALWATWHPTEVPRRPFIAKIEKLIASGVRVCVGAVGVAETIDELISLRRELPPEVYLWINAQRPRPRPYSHDERSLFQSLDPHFERFAGRSRSLGRFCQAGETSFTVDGEGEMRRCHFVDEPIGNIYRQDWEEALSRRACPNRFCDCYLGRSQFEAEELRPLFGDGLLERMPIAAAPAALVNLVDLELT